MIEISIERLINSVPSSSEEDTLLYFRSKLKEMKVRYGSNVSLFNTHSIKLLNQIKLMEQMVSIRRNIERTQKIDNLLEAN